MCYVLSLQGVPPGSPSLLAPKLDKLDFPHLQRDIKKFDDAGVFSIEDKSWWDTFLDSFMEKYGQIPTEIPPWPVDSFRTSGERPSLPLPQVSTKLQDLHNAEQSTPPEVH